MTISVRYSNCGWACFGKITSRKKICQNGNLTIERIKKAYSDAVGEFSEDAFVNNVHNMLVHPDGKVIFTLYDGTTVETTVQFYSPEARKYLDPHTKIYGYTWNDSEYVINEEEATVIRTVYDDYLGGMSISDITRKNEALGYCSKRGKFSRKFVLYLLSNPFYIGTRIYPAAYSGIGKDEIVENDHAAIIDKETFRKVAERRKIYADRHKNSRNA